MAGGHVPSTRIVPPLDSASGGAAHPPSAVLSSSATFVIDPATGSFGPGSQLAAANDGREAAINARVPPTACRSAVAQDMPPFGHCAASPPPVAPSAAAETPYDDSSAAPLVAAASECPGALDAPISAAQSEPEVPCSTGRDCYCSVLDFLLLVGQLKKLKRTGWLRNGVPPHRAESVAEHSFRAAVCALLIGCDRQSAELVTHGKLDRNRCVKMALVHDLAEVLVGDITPFCAISPEEKSRREKEAMRQICALLPAAPSISPAALQRCPACTACSDRSAMSDSDDVHVSSEVTTGSCVGNNDRSSTTDIPGPAAEILSLFAEYEAGKTAEAKFVRDIDKFEMILQAYEYEAEASGEPTLPASGSRQLRAREPALPHGGGTRAAQDEDRSSPSTESAAHQHGLKDRANLRQLQTRSISPASQQQQHTSQPVLQQKDWQQQQRVPEGRRIAGQATTPVLQIRPRTLTAYSPTTLQQQAQQLEPRELTDKQQQQQQDERQPWLQQHSKDLLPFNIEETSQHRPHLSSFFHTTNGVFKSALFRTLDTLLRERRRDLHGTGEPP